VRLHVLRTPLGPAPESIRAAWIGLSLPIARAGRGLAGRPKLVRWVGDGEPKQAFVIDAPRALRLLAERNAEAAQWWQERHPDQFAPGAIFQFDEGCGEIELRTPARSLNCAAELVRARGLVDDGPNASKRTAEPGPVAVLAALLADRAGPFAGFVRDCGDNPSALAAWLARAMTLDQMRRWPPERAVLSRATQLAAELGHAAIGWEPYLLALVDSAPPSWSARLSSRGLTRRRIALAVARLPCGELAADLGPRRCRHCGHTLAPGGAPICPECGETWL
jgi:hypothetical protein